MPHPDVHALSSHNSTQRLIALGGIAALASLAVQIIVPALPLIAQGIGATARDAQLIIPVYSAGLALGQLIWGPLADRHGRRPVLLLGLIIFLCGTLCCACAPNLLVLLIGRGAQSIGAAATVAAARVMATDRAPAGHVAAPLAVLTSVALVSPAVAPVVGGALVGLVGWRALFLILGVAISAAIVIAWPMLPESRPVMSLSGPVVRVAHGYRAVLRDVHYLRLALSSALIAGGFQLFLAVSPFLFANAGLNTAQAGMCYSAVACAIILGTLAVPRLMRWRPHLAAQCGAITLAVGAAVTLMVGSLGISLAGLLTGMICIALGAGLTGPTFMAEAIEGQRRQFSTAIGLYGAVQTGGAAIIATIVVRFSSHQVSIATTGLLVALALLLRNAPTLILPWRQV
jgi:DHA1 family bicyclomycin/chloramphenicol resistance-like MFS transporter